MKIPVSKATIRAIARNIHRQEKEQANMATERGPENQIELLPCPFCGGKAAFNNDGERWDQVICSSCGCRGCEHPNSQQKAADAWNLRSWKNLDRIIDALEAAGCCKNGRVHAPEDVVAGAIRNWLGQHQGSDDDKCRQALLDLLHVSFPPVGLAADEYLISKHNDAVERACELLGIDGTASIQRS